MFRGALRLVKKFSTGIKEGKEVSVTAVKGKTVLEICKENGLKVDGACGGKCQCTTCHIILDDKIYNKLPIPSTNENAQLDFSFEKKPTSRLGCQVQVTEDLQNTKIKLPQKTRSYQVDKQGNWKLSEEEVRLFFIKKDGTSAEAIGKIGQTLLQIAKQNDVPVEGACEASLACSTCHVILPEKIFNEISQASMTEEDLLDLAYDIAPTSRLGCQIKISKLFEGQNIRLPSRTKNFRVEEKK